MPEPSFSSSQLLRSASPFFFITPSKIFSQPKLWVEGCSQREGESVSGLFLVYSSDLGNLSSLQGIAYLSQAWLLVNAPVKVETSLVNKLP